jgi:hypothetical protein
MPVVRTGDAGREDGGERSSRRREDGEICADWRPKEITIGMGIGGSRFANLRSNRGERRLTSSF